MKIRKHLNRFLFRLNKNHYSEEFPYKFNNTKKLNKLVDIGLGISDETKEAFKFSYKNFIEAVHEKDCVYIDKICEKSFSTYLINSLESDKKALYINKINESDIKIEIDSIGLEFHFFVTKDRELNKQLSIQESKKGTSLPFLGNFKLSNMLVYENKTKNVRSCVVRISVDFNTNYTLCERPSNEPSNLEIHNVIFEAQFNEPTAPLALFDQRMHKILSHFISKEQLDWSISALDLSLDQNKLI
jgi:hypothetical protein